MIVLDASAIVELLLGSSQGMRVADELTDESTSVHVPHLADVEVARALRRLVAARRVDDTVAGKAVDELQNLPLVRHGHDVLLDRIWAMRKGVSAYDATYLALAEVLGATLVTCDRRLAKASGPHVTVSVI